MMDRSIAPHLKGATNIKYKYSRTSGNMRSLLFLLCVLLVQRQGFSLSFGAAAKQTADDADDASEQVEISWSEPDAADGSAAVPVSASVRGAAKHVANEDFATGSIFETFFASSASDADVSSALKETIRQMANDDYIKTFLRETRRSLHRHPDVMYQEDFASRTIQAVLAELDIPFSTGWAKNTHEDVYPGKGGYGVVAHIGKREAVGPCIILRADMDALPILEATKDIDGFKSENAGKMHACGHDGHVTMLLGAAALLKKIEDQITVGTIRLVFQPAEEGGAGMKRMVEEGVVSMEPRAQEAYGLHVWPTLPTGTVASRPGPLLAASETFEIRIEGKGGHAAMPHLTIDPIVTASALVSNLQTLISRTISPLESGVISVTQISAGDAFNVIPASAMLRGTIRALSTDMLVALKGKVEGMVRSTASLYGCNSTIRFSPDFYPPTVNDEGLFQWSKNVGALVSREDNLRDIEPTMGGEDFAFLAQEVPSTFFLVGQGSGGRDNEKYHVPRTDFGLHHPSFALDENVLPIGAELHVNLALRSLKRLSQDGEELVKAEL
uniref:Peptidase M20 dimerisation domain-containing protein n=1 Tax=Odontella aurita TaxID=265563 RepID=A0A7S4HTQ4_9STRA|mmetsp:Transcript_14920/g.43454  ORF Transcript_14920/g.43454 Transcript_14920/m.43454 type:complete len:556 (+) Transcript_14920:51-1718(+)